MKFLYTLLGLGLIAGVAYAQTPGGIILPQGGLGVTSMPAGSILVGNNSLRVTGTTSPTIGYLTATSSNATSTFLGGLGIGTSTTNNSLVNIDIANPSANQILFRISTGASLSRFTIDEDGDISAAGTIGGTTITGSTLTSTGDINTTGAGDDLWLGNSTQTSAKFRAYATGQLNVENIGISTTTPFALLSIGASSTNASNIPLMLVSTSTANSTSTAFAINSEGQVSVGNGNPLLDFNVQGDSYFSGNIGIGTTTPVAMLSVNKTGSDTLSITNSHFYFTNQNAGYNIGLMGQQLNSSPYSFVLQNTNGALNYFAPIVLNPLGGDIGIGTTSPALLEGGSSGDRILSISSNTVGNRAGEIELAGVDNSSGFGNAFGRLTFTRSGDALARISSYRTAVAADAGQLSFQVANTGQALSESMVIAPTGNVGIGTSSPSAKLVVTSANPTSAYPAYSGIHLSSGGDAYYTAYSLGRSGIDSYWAVSQGADSYLLGSTAGDTAIISLGNDIHLGNAGLGTAPTVTVKSGALVGIGTTTPTTKFQVNANDAALSIKRSTAGTGSIYFDIRDNTDTELGYFGYGSSALDFYVANVSDGNTLFYNDGGTRMTIAKDTGYIGIGTTTPTGMLYIDQGAGLESAPPSAGTASKFLNITNDSLYGLLLGSLGTGNGYIQAQRTDGAATVYNLLLQPNGGNVGIGTPLPRTILDITNGTANIDGNTANIANFTGANVAMTTSNANLSINTNDAQGADIGGSISLGGLYRAAARNNIAFGTIKAGKTNSTDSDVAGYLSFGTRNTDLEIAERMRITSAGNVGIGTTTPETKLTLTGISTSYASEVGSLMINNSTNPLKRLIFGIDTTQGTHGVGYIQSVYTGTDYLPLSLQTEGGKVGIGTTSPMGKFSIATTTNSVALSVDTNGVITNTNGLYSQLFAYGTELGNASTTLTTADVYYPVRGYATTSPTTSPTNSGSSYFTVDAYNGSTTVKVAGIYSLSFQGSFEANKATVIHGDYYLDGVEMKQCANHSAVSNTTNESSLNINCLVRIGANQTLDVYVKSSEASVSITWQSLNRTLTKVAEY